MDYDRENFSPMSADFILMEGIRMVDEWPIIEKKIPSMDIVFRPAVDPGSDRGGGGRGATRAASAKRSAASSSNKIRLTRDEERDLPQGGRHAHRAGASSTPSGLSEFDTCRILFDLLNRNLITHRGPRARQAKEVGRAGGGGRRPRPATSWPRPRSLLALVGDLRARGHALRGGRDGRRSCRSRTTCSSTAVSHSAAGAARPRRARLPPRAGQPPPRSRRSSTSGLVDRRYLKDPWARPYHYALTANGYLLSAVDDAGKKVVGTAIERVLPVEKR